MESSIITVDIIETSLIIIRLCRASSWRVSLSPRPKPSRMLQMQLDRFDDLIIETVSCYFFRGIGGSQQILFQRLCFCFIHVTFWHLTMDDRVTVFLVNSVVIMICLLHDQILFSLPCERVIYIQHSLVKNISRNNVSTEFLRDAQFQN